VSPHSPKSHTPFQWEKQDTKEEFLEKIYLLKDRLKKYKQVKLSWRDPEVSHIECILGRGDRRLADVIYSAWKNGARFDGWNEHFRYQEWTNAFIESGIELNHYLEEIPEENNLPWDHIDKGVTKSFLRKERQNAYREVQTIDCKDGPCIGCGIQRKNGFGELTRCYVKIEDKSEDLSNSAVEMNKQADDSSKLSSTDHQQRTIYHYRIQFTKNDYSKYLGHFDIVRAFERACRRAKIEVAHSQGFNPRPKLSFSPPLKLGYTSEAEYVDIQVYEKSAIHIRDKLNSNLPDGIEILKIITVNPPIPSLMASINAMEYQINVADQEISKSSINQFLDDSEIPVSRKVKGKIKTIDIRPYIESIEKKDCILIVHTRMIEGRTARMDEVISQLLSDHRQDSKSFPVHRKRQLIKKNGSILTPMELR
jgi:radical SAM-linked protein